MGYARLARQAAFTDAVAMGRQYVMIDDFIGQGGTLANLRGWVEQQGCEVMAPSPSPARRTRPRCVLPGSNCMNSDGSTAGTSRSGGETSSVTPSTALLNRKLGTSLAPRMLTRSEIALLQRSKKEMGQVVHEILSAAGSPKRT